MAKLFIKQPPEGVSDEVKDWLMDFQQRVADALDVMEPNQLILPVHNNAPTRRQSDGVELIVADGTNWNPGSGAGVYEDDGSTYTKL